jgi:hypothetical protein
MWVRSVYTEGEALIAAEHYQEAREQLRQIRDKDYNDTDALLLLCEAHMAYDVGDISNAYYKLKIARFSYQPPESRQKISSFTARIDDEYNAYREEQYQLEMKEYEVWDNRDQDTSRPASKPSSSSKGSSDSDPYHANDYSDAEDFYYDYYDDFFDYYDAESYFNEHHK